MCAVQVMLRPNMRHNIVCGDPKAHLSTVERTQSSTDVFGAVEQDELGVGGLDTQRTARIQTMESICALPHINFLST